jgi:uncharacterized delta-60 repeat protein
VARFDTAGNLDPTFGIGGTTLAWPSGGLGWDQAIRAAVQPDGEIVVAGGTSQATGFYVGRFTTAGALDPTFGNGGVVRTVIGAGNQMRDMLLQPDGKIVVSGDASLNVTTDDFGLARYLGAATATTSAVPGLGASPGAPAVTSSNATAYAGPGAVATPATPSELTARPSAHLALLSARPHRNRPPVARSVSFLDVRTVSSRP